MDLRTDARFVDRSGRTYPYDEVRWQGDDGSPLMSTDLPGLSGPDDIDPGRANLWRYAAALPAFVEPVTLGEGQTPLLPHRIPIGAEVLVKAEYLNPTGSFKDRGSSVLVAHLRALGVPGLLEDSSGNGGSSMSGYAAAAGLRAKILVPDSTSPAKITMSRLFGAEIELVPGPRQATSDEAVRQSGEIFYASHAWHPYFLQGTKTLAYGLWEDLGFRAPDNVVIPTGGGSLVLGCAIGFGELLRAGLIPRLPRLFITQPAACAPLVRALDEGLGEVDAGWQWQPTIAEGTAITKPVRDREVLAAVRDSGGGGVAVNEAAIVAAVRAAIATGLYPEPTSATALAGLERFISAGILDPDATTVVVLTGSGLKAADAMTRLLDTP